MQSRILVIRGGAIGDFILTLPAIKLLREAFPQAHLEILGYKHIIALAEGRRYADATRSIEYSAMSGFFVPRSELEADLSAYFASFGQVISYLFDPDGIFAGNLRRAGVKNLLPAFARIDDSAHATHQLARPLQSLALYLDDAAATVHPSEDDRAFAAQFLPRDERPLFALHAGSGSAQKNWPIDRWLAVARTLLEAGHRLVIVGGEADGAQLEALAAGLDADSLLIARDLPLPQLAAVLERCGLFLGHDSGISHLAAAVQIRCLLLFGPTDPSIWAPSHPHVTVLQAPDGQLEALPVATVLAEVAAHLPTVTER